MLKALNKIAAVLKRSKHISSRGAMTLIKRYLVEYHLYTTTIYTYMTTEITTYIKQVHYYEKVKKSVNKRLVRKVNGWIKKSSTLRLVWKYMTNQRISREIRYAVAYKLWTQVLSKSSRISTSESTRWILRILREYHVTYKYVIRYVTKTITTHITIVHRRIRAERAAADRKRKAAARKAAEYKRMVRYVKGYWSRSSDLEKIFHGLKKFHISY